MVKGRSLNSELSMSTIGDKRVDHLIVSIVYILVVQRPSNDVRSPLYVCHPCCLHMEPAALYLH